jgi:hypothetical protein
MKKVRATNLAPRQFVRVPQYRGVLGKVVDRVEHRLEESLLYRAHRERSSRLEKHCRGDAETVTKPFHLLSVQLPLFLQN